MKVNFIFEYGEGQRRTDADQMNANDNARTD